MLFNSLAFAVFFPVTSLIYFLLPHRYRWAWLLCASCVFYMWFVPAYILLLFLLIAVDYAAALIIEREHGRARKVSLWVSIGATCAALLVFKYFNFLNSNIEALFGHLGISYRPHVVSWILPVGLSFHTFQSLSYVFEVYRGRFKAERHFGIYALYVMFFPQLVAGPIERPQKLLPQLRAEHSFDYFRFREGIALMAWGLFKKIVVADRLAAFTDRIFAGPASFLGPTLVVGVIAFTIQIYSDFSGYSDMARGAARAMGIELSLNFDRPFFSSSTAELWRRMHISLSSWLRDYVYLPLLGGSPTRTRRWGAILFTFLLSGLWHGANWTFVAWGAVTGLYFVASDLTRPLRSRAAVLLGVTPLRRMLPFFQAIVTSGLYGFSLIFFRSPSMSSALDLLTGMSRNWNGWSGFLFEAAGSTSLPWILGTLSAVAILFTFEYLQESGRIGLYAQRAPVGVRWACCFGFALLLVFLGSFEERRFAYFQF